MVHSITWAIACAALGLILTCNSAVWAGVCCHVLAVTLLLASLPRAAGQNVSRHRYSFTGQTQQQIPAEMKLATTHTSSRVMQPDQQLMKQLRSWSFDDALNFDACADMMRAHNQDALAKRLASACPEVLHMVFMAIDSSKKANQLVVQFKPETWAMIKAGSLRLMKNAKTGVTRATAVNSSTGRIVEQAVVSTPGMANLAANILTIAVTSAHLVAGWDNAKSLKRIEKKLDVIHQRWENDWDAKMRSVFELFQQNVWRAETIEGKHSLLAARNQVKELRQAWFNELVRSLTPVEGDATWTWTEWIFGKDTSEAKRTKAELEAAARKPLLYMRLALILEQQIAHAMQDDFAFSLILPGVFERADQVLQIVTSKIARIATLDPLVAQQAQVVHEALRNFKASVDPSSCSVASQVQVEYLNGEACGITIEYVGSP